MGRLIDADVLLSEMEKLSDLSARYKDEYLSGMQQRLETCIELVEDAPTVDAVPTRHGRWVHHPEIGWGSTWLCSECGEKTVETIMGEPRYKFCPNCGADMRKDGDHAEGTIQKERS